MSASIMTNLESVSELIGSLQGMSEAMDEPEYMNQILKEAHGKATDAFDMAAAATAKTGALAHMYEFGTAGITRGPVSHPNPLAADARLWQHTSVVNPGGIDAGFVFRPALTRNPQPTVKSTGVPSKYLRKLSRRKYVFWNRAVVMETGAEVEIKAKTGRYVFVPFNGEPARNSDNNGRTFMFYDTQKHGAITARPGNRHKGTFTAFWNMWWMGSGENIVSGEVTRTVIRDIKMAEVQAERRARRVAMKSALASNPSLAYQKSSKVGERSFGV